MASAERLQAQISGAPLDRHPPDLLLLGAAEALALAQVGHVDGDPLGGHRHHLQDALGHQPAGRRRQVVEEPWAVGATRG
jgi:hypothetical protein